MSKPRAQLNIFNEQGRILFDYLPMPSYVWKVFENDLVLIKYNNAAIDITNGNIKNYIGIKASELYKDRPDILQDLYKCANEKSNFFKEINYNFMSINLEKYLSVNYGFIPPDIVIVHTNDITEKKLAEQATLKANEELKKSEEKLAKQKLEESEEKYRLISENANDLIVIANEKLDIIYINELALLKLFGYHSEEVIGESALKFIHPDDIERSLKSFKIGLSKGENIDEIRLQHKNGHYLWVEAKLSTYLDDMDKSKAIIILRDISERKIADQKLLQTKNDLRQRIKELSLLYNISNLFEKENISNEIILSNIVNLLPPAFQFPKYVCARIINNNIEYKTINFKTTKWNLTYSEIINEVLLKIEIFYQEEHLFKEEEIQLITEIGRRLKNFLESKESERKLKESEQKHRLITENVNDLIIILNQDYKYEYINQAQHRKQRGTSNEDLIGTTPLDLIHPDDKEKNKRAFKEVFEVGEGVLETRVRNLWGGYNWFEIKGKTFEDVDGKTKVLLISRDITERKEVEKKLRESEEKYRLIAENANDMIYILNQNYKLEYINENVVEKHFGFTNQDLIGKSPLDFVHLDDREKVLGGLKQGFQKGEGIIEVRLRDKYNKYHWLEIKGKIFKDIDGKSKSLSIAREITERKLADQQLHESEEKFRTLTEQSFLGIAIIQDYLIKYVNKKIANIFGYPISEISTWEVKEFLKVIHIEDRRFVVEQLSKKQSGEPEVINEYQFRGVKKNGDIIWLEVFSKSINYEGKPADFVTLIDITEKKIAEEKLRKSEERYRLISENSGSAVWETDMNLNLTYVSESSPQILGYSFEEAMNLPLSKKMTSESLKKIAAIFKEEIKIEKKERKDITRSRSLVIDQIHKNGTLIPSEITFTFLRDDNEKAIGILGVTRDITERKKAEQELRKSEEKYRDAYDRANFYKDLFAHDINNVLQVINSSTDLINYYLNSFEKIEEISTLTEMIKKQVARAKLLVQNVNTLSELEQGIKPIKTIEMYEILQNSINYVRTAYQEKALDISVESFSSRIFAQANELLQEVFDNLLINSVRYNDNPLIEILVKVSREKKGNKKFIRLEFIDNGIGINNERKEIIFKRYHREYKGQKGMGLGLSLVKKILSGFNGKIWVENRIKDDYTKGSNFIVLIPETP